MATAPRKVDVTTPAATPSTAWKLKGYHWPATVVARLTATRTARTATFVALLFGTAVASKALGYASAYHTLAERTQLAATFHNNLGLNVILGVPHGIDGVPGFTAWNALGIFAIIGSIWGLLVASRSFRGEEDNGRLELVLAGQTTPRRAAANTYLGLAAALMYAYILIAIIFVSVGRVSTVDYSTRAALFFALVSVSGAAMFIAIGGLASQLLPTRTIAARAAAAIFGISFLLRATADTTGAHWLLNFTPLGWIEKSQPLYQTHAVWLAPIGLLIAGVSGLAIWLAGRRDLGASIIPDKDTAKPRLTLLKTPFRAAVRLTRPANLGWLAALTVVSTLFGLLAQSAAQALEQSANASQRLGHLAGAARIEGAATFLGIVFFLLMNLLMLYAASALGAIREDEAQGYLDNFLVRRISRLRWLGGRLLIVLGTICLAAGITSLTVWLAETSQHAGVGYHQLFLAAVNGLSPVLLLLGMTIFAFGVLPRHTTLVGYGVVAWSFMMQLLSSGINLNHWLLDTAILHHVALAPAVEPAWHTNVILVAIGLVLAAIGVVVFNRRDLQAE